MARDFCANQGAKPQPYFVYGKVEQRRVAQKDPAVGRFVIVQTRPKIASMCGLCLKIIMTEVMRMNTDAIWREFQRSGDPLVYLLYRALREQERDRLSRAG